MLKQIIPLLAVAALAVLTPVHAQTTRTEFISYDMREDAEKGARDKNQHYRALELTATDSGYRTTLDVPVLWLDREIFLHTEDMTAEIVVNGRAAAVADSGAAPSEFDITACLTDGPNTIEFVNYDRSPLSGTTSATAPRAFIHSQPKLRIEDFTVTAEPDSLNKYGILTIRIALSNSYNFPEEMNVGYDIYDPAGKLLYFDNRNALVPGLPGGGRDTVEFREFIYGTPANLWSAEKPTLYNVMLIARRGSRVTEYIPLRIGFGRTELIDGHLTRNGKAVDIKAVRYNAAADSKTTADELARLRKAGVNTLLVDHPQPHWFYDLTDRTGLYVFDQPDLHSAGSTDPTPGGTPANDPRLTPDYLMRTRQAFSRSRNHTSVAGWSLSGDHGNGYNLYKTYQWLKNNDPARPVIYNGAAGEWNSDMPPIEATDSRTVLDKPAAARRR